MKETFLCGEFARICNLPKKTVQYYDEIGLLSPAYVDENGYRRYTVREIHRAGAIRALQAVGLSLREVCDVLGNSDLTAREAVLREQEARLDEKIQALKQYKNLLEITLRSLSDFRAHTLGKLYFQQRPEAPIETYPIHGLASSVNVIETTLSGGMVRPDGTTSKLLRIAGHGVQANEVLPAGKYCYCYLSCLHTREAVMEFYDICRRQNVVITEPVYFLSISNSLFEIRDGIDLLQFFARCEEEKESES